MADLSRRLGAIYSPHDRGMRDTRGTTGGRAGGSGAAQRVAEEAGNASGGDIRSDLRSYGGELSVDARKVCFLWQIGGQNLHTGLRRQASGGRSRRQRSVKPGAAVCTPRHPTRGTQGQKVEVARRLAPQNILSAKTGMVLNRSPTRGG